MSMATLEREILAELQQVSGRMSLKKKDIREWSTGDIKECVDETRLYLPSLQVNVSVLTSVLGKAKPKQQHGGEGKTT